MNSFAPTEGRWALLRPLYPTDVELLFNAEVARSNWWRLRGKTPSAGEYDAILAMNVEVQFMICARAAPHTPLGLVAAYSMDTRNGHCYLAVMRVGDEQGIPKAMVEGLGMFLDYIFLGWPVRKIFAETDSVAVSGWSSTMGRLFETEAVLANYYYYGGSYIDKIIASASKDRWMKFRDKLGFAQLYDSGGQEVGVPS